VKAAFAVILALLAGCAPGERIATRVRDPWQVAVVRVTKTGDVPYEVAPRAAARGDRGVGKPCEWRDEAGFPHFCDHGDFGVADGRFVTPYAARDGPSFRLTAHLLGYGWCRKPRRRCWGVRATIAFVTPASNVIAFERVPLSEETLPAVVGTSY
jgi:hypothetical protein